MNKDLTIENIISILAMRDIPLFGRILSKDFEEVCLYFDTDKYKIKHITREVCYKTTNSKTYEVTHSKDIPLNSEYISEEQFYKLLNDGKELTVFLNRMYFSKEESFKYKLPSEATVCAIVSKDSVELTIKDDNFNLLKINKKLSNFLKNKLQYDVVQENLEEILKFDNHIVGCTLLNTEEYETSTKLINYTENRRYIPGELITCGDEKNYGYLRKYDINNKRNSIDIKDYNGVLKTNRILSMQNIIRKMTKATVKQLNKGNKIALFIGYFNLPEISEESKIRVYIILGSDEIRYTVADDDNEILVTSFEYNKIIGKSLLTKRV